MRGHEASSPPNGGASAWLRVAAYAVVCIGTLGVQYAFGPFYTLLLEEFGSPPAATSFVGSLCVGLMDSLAVFSGMLIERIGSSRTCILGAIIASSGMALSACTTRLWHLYITYGVIVGVGTSMAFMSPIVLMSQWFTTRLALSHAIGNMASALVPLAFGPSAVPIFEAVGRRVAMLSLAAFMLVSLTLAGLVLTPPARRYSRSDLFTNTVGTNGVAAETASVDAAAAGAEAKMSPTASPPAGSVEEASRALGDAAGNPYCGALRHRPMRLIMFATCMYGTGTWIPIVHLVRFGRECGLPPRDAAFLLTYLAIGSFTLRAPLACLADHSGRRAVFAATALVYAAICVVAALAAGTPAAGVCHVSNDSLVATNGSSATDSITADAQPGISARIMLPLFAYGCGGFTGAMNSIAVALASELGMPRAHARAGAALNCSPLGVGFLIGPVLGGALHDVRARYMEPLIFGALMLTTASGCVLLSLRCTVSVVDTQKHAPSRTAVPASKSSTRERPNRI